MAATKDSDDTTVAGSDVLDEVESPPQPAPQPVRAPLIERRFTRPGGDVYADIEWTYRSAAITSDNGEIIFEQEDIETPSFWSQTAANIVASKYFYGALDSPERERSMKTLVDRVVGTITGWGRAGGYFTDQASASAFEQELRFLLINQYAAFNSPVWFNVGVEAKPQCSACFINSVDDTMESIMDLAKREALLFKWGSGTGSNLSTLRSSREPLAGGGVASGPVSFMRGYDAFANVIKSGGKTRRAAKMIILNAEHPDVLEFIHSKAYEERKAWALIDAGYDGSLNGDAYSSVSFQNANHSVRVSDAFMQAVEADESYWTRAVTTGKPMDQLGARDVLRAVSEATHQCGDPGLQFDTTINDWNPCAATDRIYASNPCVTGDTLVATEDGLRRIDSMVGETPRVTGLDGELHRTARVIETGVRPVYRLRTQAGYELNLTGDHRVWTIEHGDVPAAELEVGDTLQLLGSPFGATALDVRMAEYVGLMLGDGSIGRSDRIATLTLGKRADEAAIAQRIADLVNEFPRHRGKVHVTERGSTVAVATVAASVRSELERYAVLDAGAEQKQLTDAALQLDRPAMAGLLRGLFTADGTVADYSDKSQYISLDSTSLTMLRQVQLALLGFGIKAKLYRDRRSAGTELLPDGRGGQAEYPVHAMHSLRISRSSRLVFEREIGFMPESAKSQRLRDMNRSTGAYQDRLTDVVTSVELIGDQAVYDLTEPVTDHFVANGIAVHNCSEYMFLNDTACNLASLNLLKFYDLESHEFDVEGYRHACRVLITAQEIIVSNASYPSDLIGENSERFRPLGLGYTNLGALLMARGLPYDSVPGRALAAAVTAIMTGEAYAQSARVAERIGPFEAYAENRESFTRVIGKHRAAVAAIEGLDSVAEPLRAAAEDAWAQAQRLGELHGFRNAQATVLAPTGTIAFMMDCDTTGVEPDLALVKYKNLSGGGYIKLVNRTVPAALARLGYSDEQIASIVAAIDADGTIERAEALKPEHLPIFDCAFRPAAGVRSIAPLGHVRMLGAVQPFISGAVSKTVNVPEEASVEEIMDTYAAAWKLGVKAIAIYRDNSKRIQPLETGERVDGRKVGEAAQRSSPSDTPLVLNDATSPPAYRRHRLPDERNAITHKFTIGEHEGYITIGEYADGSPGEVFVQISKEGSAISGLMDAVGALASVALQSGVPLATLVKKFRHMRFEPSGWTRSPEIGHADSILDYLFRWMGHKYLIQDDSDAAAGQTRLILEEEIRLADEAAGPAPITPTATMPAAASLSVREDAAAYQAGAPDDPRAAFQNQLDAPPCAECGSIMVRSGSCFRCYNCGATSGCS